MADSRVQRIINGDKDAFNSLCRERYPSLLSYARLFLTREWAEDVIQDVFLGVWQNRSKLNPESDLQGYLVSSVYRRCINVLTRTKTAGRYASWYRYKISSLLSADCLSPEHNPIIARVYRSELASSLNSSISSLPDRCREIFSLSYIDHLSAREIAQRLKLSERTVENQIYIALKLLRTKLEKI